MATLAATMLNPLPLLPLVPHLLLQVYSVAMVSEPQGHLERAPVSLHVGMACMHAVGVFPCMLACRADHTLPTPPAAALLKRKRERKKDDALGRGLRKRAGRDGRGPGPSSSPRLCSPLAPRLLQVRGNSTICAAPMLTHPLTKSRIRYFHRGMHLLAYVLPGGQAAGWAAAGWAAGWAAGGVATAVCVTAAHGAIVLRHACFVQCCCQVGWGSGAVLRV